MSSTLTTAAPPTTAEVAADELAWIAAQSGVLTDLNTGSQIRTEAEALGSVVEMQSVIAQAQAFEAIVYAAWGAFNIIPRSAIPAIVDVTFVTGTEVNPPVAPAPITIPAGTVVQTVGGVQFTTVAAVTMPAGGTTVDAIASAVIPGAGGNVAAGSINQIATSLSYPLQVSNAAPGTGGEDTETPAQTMARFTAVVASIGLGTPVGIANACIGVSVSGTAEVVLKSTVYEPWITQIMQGVANPTPGFDVYVDNGSGSASANLLAAVAARLDGSLALGEDGYRPAGVPYTVNAVIPIYCDLTVTGNSLYPTLDTALNTYATAAVDSYFAGLGFGETADKTQIIAAVANVVAGNVNTLGVTMLDVNDVDQSQITATGIQRVILRNLTVDFS